MNAATALFIADTDPAFMGMRADVRENIRTAEILFREAIQEEVLDKVPPELARALASAVTDLPPRFIRGLQPFFACLCDMLDAAEMLSAELSAEQKTRIQ
jgi:hypothetical protein